MRILVISILLLLGFTSNGQLEFPKKPVDMGVIGHNGSDYVDIPVQNVSDQKIFIFRIDADKRFQIFYSSKTILPDSTIYIRLLFTPDKKGAFNEKLLIHFSHLSEPTPLMIEGFCEEIPRSNDIACPSFDQQKINTSLEHEFTVIVIDETTKKPIETASVLFIRNGIISKSIETDKKGQFSDQITLGYYYFVAEKEGYLSNEMGAYVNRKNNLVIIPLKPIEPTEGVNVTENVNEVPVPENEMIIENLIVEIDSTTIPINESYPSLPASQFKPNNIVFLLDVSSSMNLAGKMDLLKASMIELTKVLRPIDKITLVAYSSSANVILETTSVEQIDTIISIIKNLEPKGMTAGGKGMNLAYFKACNSFIQDGNNQIIMVTDGVFNMGEEDVNKLAKKFKKKGVTVSVVGIKNRDFHQETMEQLSIDGGGNYINITSYEQAKSSLIEEIKKQSKIIKP